MELRAVLKNVHALAGLSDADLDALERAMVVDAFDDGHVFVREGKHGDTAFLVVEGNVAVTRHVGDVEDEVNRLGPGEFFGLIALVENERRSATCRAVGATRVAALPQSAFVLLFNAQAPVAYALQRALAEQLARDFRHLDTQIRAELSKPR